MSVTPAIDKLAMQGVRLNSYYVQWLCSPSRTALLSGRYAYTLGMNDEVIQNGQPDQLATNIRTMADLLVDAGWNTSAYGKWDAGMTTWGCTPTCRGFQHYSGYYNADNDYFSHVVGTPSGTGLDLRHDFAADVNQTGVYSTHLITQRVQQWIRSVVAAPASTSAAPAPPVRSFAYVAYQAIHAPMQVPAEYVRGDCVTRVPASQPVRRMACGMLAAADEGVANITATYDALGILNDTLFVFTTDNGGNTDTGGSNWPLRGMKATSFEGGVRGAAFVSGAGLAPGVAGSAWEGMMHVSDWLPTLVAGAANLSLAPALQPRHPWQPPPPALDGVNQWAALSQGGASARTEVLLNLNTQCYPDARAPCRVPGAGAIRVGRWKLIHGHVSQYESATTNVTSTACVLRDGVAPGHTTPLNITKATSPPFCPLGWTPPPELGLPPLPPADVAACDHGAPCIIPAANDYIAGGTWLFDVVADPLEQHDAAAEQPQIVATLLARLQQFNATRVPQSNSAFDPAANPDNFGGVWTPWRGAVQPSACDPNTTATMLTPDWYR
jgi:arylsulfatase A-like enzyme